MLSPQISPSETVYRNKYQHIDRVTADFGDFKKEFFVNRLSRRVGLLILRGGDVLLVRQWRLLIRDLGFEIPGGRIDEGETPEQAAIREGLEETALHCRTVKPLLYFHPGLDTFDNPTFLFYSDDFAQGPLESLHKEEVAEQIWLPLSKSIEMIYHKEIIDSMTIVALLSLHALRANPQLEPRL